jgi:hypothetical protein
VQRSVASQDDGWQVPAAAVIGPQNLTGCSLVLSSTPAARLHGRSRNMASASWTWPAKVSRYLLADNADARILKVLP